MVVNDINPLDYQRHKRNVNKNSYKAYNYLKNYALTDTLTDFTTKSDEEPKINFTERLIYGFEELKEFIQDTLNYCNSARYRNIQSSFYKLTIQCELLPKLLLE